MSKWNLSIVAAALVTLASQVLVTAQIRQPMPVPAGARQPIPLAAPEPSQASQQPVKRQMPQSGAEEPGTNDEVQVNSTKIYSRKGQPHLALTAEGLVQYRYLGDQLTSELIQQGDVTGMYSYDRGGRFERIDYSDELVITATYGEHNELVRLTSSAGRSIDFGYHADVHPIRSVTPTEDFNRFHSAVALLRLKTPPSWWPEQPAMEHLMDNENKGGKESSSGNG